MKSMKASIIYEAGGPERLILREREIPTPEDGQVLVRVRAFGLNRSELMTRKGFSPDVVFPRILGIECVGEVVCDPSGQWSPGQRVAACMGAEAGRVATVAHIADNEVVVRVTYIQFRFEIVVVHHPGTEVIANQGDMRALADLDRHRLVQLKRAECNDCQSKCNKR